MNFCDGDGEVGGSEADGGIAGDDVTCDSS